MTKIPNTIIIVATDVMGCWNEKIDEIPFDYIRKKVSIVVKHDDHYRIITKGALEEVQKR